MCHPHQINSCACMSQKILLTQLLLTTKIQHKLHRLTDSWLVWNDHWNYVLPHNLSNNNTTLLTLVPQVLYLSVPICLFCPLCFFFAMRYFFVHVSILSIPRVGLLVCFFFCLLLGSACYPWASNLSLEATSTNMQVSESWCSDS